MVSEEERKRAIENAKKRIEESWEGWITKMTHLLETEKDEKKKKIFAGILNTAIHKKEDMLRNLEKKVLAGSPYEEVVKETEVKSKTEQTGVETKIDELGKKLERKIDKASKPMNKFIWPIIIGLIVGFIFLGINGFFGLLSSL